MDRVKVMVVKPDVELDDSFLYAPYLILNILLDCNGNYEYEDVCEAISHVVFMPAKPVVIWECEDMKDAADWYKELMNGKSVGKER